MFLNRTVRPELRKDGAGAAVVDHEKARYSPSDEEEVLVIMVMDDGQADLIEAAARRLTWALDETTPALSLQPQALRDLANVTAASVVHAPPVVRDTLVTLFSQLTGVPVEEVVQVLSDVIEASRGLRLAG